MEYENESDYVSKDITTQSIVAYSEIRSELPVKINETTGLEQIDWDSLYASQSTPELVVALLINEAELYSELGDEVSVRRSEVIKKSATKILDIFDKGLLSNMRDTSTIIDMVVDREPKLSEVEKYLAIGYSAEAVSFLWSVRDELGISLQQTHEIFNQLSFSLADEQDVELVDEALESIMTIRNVPFVGIAATILLDLLTTSSSLRDIIEGEVY